MARYNKAESAEGQTSEEKTLTLFTDMMIQKIESLTAKDGWKKPWFTDGALSWPKNLNGREYNGMNAMFLMMQCEKMGYSIPRFCTFDAVQRLNKAEKTDAKGEALPRVSILKGEKSFPILLTTFTCVDKDTKERIKYDEYKNLTDEEKKQYNVYPKLQTFRVFNIEQTNLKEARPELWAKLAEESQQQTKHQNEGEMFSFAPLDKMVKDQSWVCPIIVQHGDESYYSISKDHIVIPEKSQFKDGEAWVNTCTHEQIHSLGAEGRLNRIKPTRFGSREYQLEELVAELGSALVCQNYGITKHLKDDSATYLKSWLDSLHESPQFLKTVMLDVKKASSILIQEFDKVALEIEKEKAQEKSQTVGQAVAVSSGGKVEQKEKSETVAAKSAPRIEPTFYASVAYLQNTDDTQLFDRLQEQGDYKRILAEAAEYDNGDAPDLTQTFKSPTQNRGDDLLDENDHYAVVHNASVGGTYEVFRKIGESQVRDTLTRYGLPENAISDVKEVAAKMPEFQQEEQEERHGMRR